MGTILAKPENPHVRDRIRLCDGLEPFDVCTVAAAGAGRFVFRLAEFKWKEHSDGTRMLSITMDYIDLLLLTRVRLTIGDFYNFGSFASFYALDERTVVLVDVNTEEETLRQRLVTIDPEKATTHAFLDRGYQLDTRSERPASTIIARSAVSEDRVLTKAYLILFDPVTVTHMAIVIPKDPFNREMRVEDLTDVLVEANFRLCLELDTPEYEYRLEEFEAPFFLSPTKVGLFVHRDDLRASQLWARPGSRLALTDVLYVDYSQVVAYDLLTDEISILRPRPDPITNFPCNHEQQQPHESQSLTVSSRQLGLLLTDRLSARGWHVIAARVFEVMADFFAWMHLVVGRKPLRMERLSEFFIDLWGEFHRIKWKILAMKKVRFGLLDTQTLQWREQQGVAEQLDFSHSRLSGVGLATFADGHNLIYNKNTSKLAARLIGCNSDNSDEPRVELRVLSNPGRCFSLKTLAEMQIRKRPIARLAIQQIAARIQY